ncbi:MAG: hypothetical protein IJ496_10365 [Ruminococcus sp.]|nr:hypothetical protein [Ruminococcus sp.]
MRRISKITAAALCAAVSFTTVPFAALLPAHGAEPALLDVSGFTILDENLVHLGADYLNDVSVLFDDQDKVPESPENMQVSSELWDATDTSTGWKPNLQSEFGDASFYIDLKGNYVITGIALLDVHGIADWTVEVGEPFGWETAATLSTDYYKSWRSVTLSSTEPTRYLRFSTPSGDTGVSEIALYGYKVSELTEEQLAKTAAKENTSTPTDLTAGQTAGFNAFIDDPMTAIMAAGNVREYHNFSWLIDENGKTRFTQGTWGDMDAYYTAMKEQNISIIPCFQGGSAVIRTVGDSVPEIPVAEGADTLDPTSYALHAQTMYQVAARYGRNTDIDLSTLNVADGSEPKVGMGLLSALENSNEPNKSWSGKNSYFSPYELAAMCSADYDGHEGTIPNAGVKTADPEFKLAMGGLLATDSMITYLTEMKLWFDYNRSDGKFAVDIINVHIGPDTVNPEDSRFIERIQELQKWIEENAPGTELWISEFEVGMSDCVVDGVDNHDNEDYQLKYAQRVARTYLLAIGAEVDRISKFQLRDEAGGGVYADSGLVTEKGSWSKKLAWYYTACLTSTLENADFVQDASDESVYHYEFRDRTTGDIIHALWSPTSDGTVIPGYTLSVDEKACAALTVPSEYAEGTTTPLTVENGSITLDVSETPVFVTVSDSEKEIVNGRHMQLRPSEICLSADFSTEVNRLDAAPEDSTLNQFYRMFDEPQTMPEMIYSDTAGLESPSTNVNASNITCYVKFDRSYSFTGFSVFDTYGTGNISVYDARTDTLLWSNDLGGYMYRNVELTDTSVPTDCLKIVKAGGDLNELAFYGFAAEQAAAHPLDTDQNGSINIFDLARLKYDLLNTDTARLSDAVKLVRYLVGLPESE